MVNRTRDLPARSIVLQLRYRVTQIMEVLKQNKSVK
jgi:hypothetical protein